MARLTFKVDRQLADDIVNACNKAARDRELRTGDKLITLMAVAHEIIREGHMPREVRELTYRACIARLTSDDQDALWTPPVQPLQ